MNNLPEFGRHFRIKGDMSSMRIDGTENNMCLRVYMRLENAWINNLNHTSETKAWKKIEKGDWAYMFEYKNDDIDSESIDGAFERFIDDVLGNQYLKYLKQNKLSSGNREEVEVLEEEFGSSYCKMVQHLQNDVYLSFEVWSKENGSFEGYACELERDKYPGVISKITDRRIAKNHITGWEIYLREEKNLRQKDIDYANERISYWKDQLNNL